MRTLDEIGAFGGKPAFAEPLHVGQLYLPEWDRMEKMFRDIFRRRFFTNNGPLVRELEQKLAAHLGVRHAITATNGTVALMVAVKALELQGEVIVPAFTFPATVQCLTWAGLTPVFCDVDPVTHNINAALAEPLITPRTSAILGVHLWGRACDPDGLTALCAKRGLSLLYDAAHAIDCTHGGRKIGRFGNIETFSFHATKVLNGSEGGCLTTNDDGLAERVRAARTFYFTGESFEGLLRINGKMSEAQAAMALLALEDLPANMGRNRRIWSLYKDRCAAWTGVGFTDVAGGEQSNYQYVILDVDPRRCPLTRDELFHLLRAENVLARRYFNPGVHQMPPYRDSRNASLSVTDDLCQRLLQLPVGALVDEAIASKIANLVDYFIGHGAEIAARLRYPEASR